MLLTSFIAGDSVAVSSSYLDYPTADGYTSKLYVNGATSFNITGTTGSNDDYVFTIPASRTEYAKGGLYNYYVRLTSGSTTQTVETGEVYIFPNPATAVNREQLATRMIDLIEKALYNQLSTGEAVESISIAGRSLSMMSRTDLLNERAFWNRELQAIRNARTGYSGIKQIRIETGNVI